MFTIVCSPILAQEPAGELDQSLPMNLKPVLSVPSEKPLLPNSKDLIKTPLPPVKPIELMQKLPLEESDTPEKSDDSIEKPTEAAVDASISLPPERPQFDLPLPPSMEPPKMEEKDEEGEEESGAQGIEKQVDSIELACIQPEVMDIVKKAGAFFHSIPIITSGYRSRGRRGSMHRLCKAVDFIVPGVSTQTLANYLKALPEAGGVGTYCHTKSVHIDTGEPRNWGYCGFRRTYFSLR